MPVARFFLFKAHFLPPLLQDLCAQLGLHVHNGVPHLPLLGRSDGAEPDGAFPDGCHGHVVNPYLQVWMGMELCPSDHASPVFHIPLLQQEEHQQVEGEEVNGEEEGDGKEVDREEEEVEWEEEEEEEEEVMKEVEV